MKKEKKPKSKTLAKRNALRFAKHSLKAGTYIAPVVPVAIETGINWDEWFNNSNGFHVGSGFIMLILSTLLTYLMVAKRKKLLEKLSAFWSVAIILVCWATSLLLLSSILHQIGFMLLYISFAIVGSAIMDEVETHVVEENLAFYTGLVSENELDRKEERKKEKAEAKRRLAEREAERELEARRRAVE